MYMSRFKEPSKIIKKECDFKELKIEDMNQENVKLLRFLVQVFCRNIDIMIIWD
jgi:hypothetical protein